MKYITLLKCFFFDIPQEYQYGYGVDAFGVLCKTSTEIDPQGNIQIEYSDTREYVNNLIYYLLPNNYYSLEISLPLNTSWMAIILIPLLSIQI